jgi:hypothetical protein
MKLSLEKTRAFWLYIVGGIIALTLGVMLLPVWRGFESLFFSGWGEFAINIMMSSALIAYILLYLVKRIRRYSGTPAQIVAIVELVLMVVIAVVCTVSTFTGANYDFCGIYKHIYTITFFGLFGKQKSPRIRRGLKLVTVNVVKAGYGRAPVDRRLIDVVELTVWTSKVHFLNRNGITWIHTNDNRNVTIVAAHILHDCTVGWGLVNHEAARTKTPGPVTRVTDCTARYLIATR